jgi:replicative DNA helicase
MENQGICNSQCDMTLHSKAAEMVILGCMLTSIQGFKQSVLALRETDFYYIEHKILFQVLKSAYQTKAMGDVDYVCKELKRLDKLGAVGGFTYLLTLIQCVGMACSVKEHIAVIKQKSMFRRSILYATALGANGWRNGNLSKFFSSDMRHLEIIEETFY